MLGVEGDPFAGCVQEASRDRKVGPDELDALEINLKTDPQLVEGGVHHLVFGLVNDPCDDRGQGVAVRYRKLVEQARLLGSQELKATQVPHNLRNFSQVRRT